MAIINHQHHTINLKELQSNYHRGFLSIILYIPIIFDTPLLYKK
ncbi:hypothetical protein ETECTG_CDS0048 [Escherichia phage ETEC-TG]|nr:hypothetical protein [Escherichia phage BI-EHEC]WPK30563.1 hypothetical protein ETECTG_CDS0048 [Escherichia phage ETEC-TG]